jgi:type II secretory pathway pseudopilin PulG
LILVLFSKGKQSGGVYILVLLSVAIAGATLAGGAELWSARQRSQQLAELDWIGEQYRLAIGSYYEASPGSVKTYPSSLQDLVLDKRYLSLRRHLRRLYENPISGQRDWAEVSAEGGGIKGIQVLIVGLGERKYVYQPQLKLSRP